MHSYLELIILLPLAGALLNTLLGGKIPRRVAEIIACSAVWGSFCATIALFFAYREPLSIEIATWLTDFEFKAPVSVYLDPLALSLCLMITFVCGLIHIYSVGYMAEDPGYVRFFALLNLFVASMLLLVLAGNLPLLYLGWEGVGLCSYALIGFWYREEQNATAGRKAFIVTRIGDTALLIGLFWLFELCGTESIPELNRMGPSLANGTVTTIGFLMLMGAAGKSAQLPLSVWLPDAMAGPTPVSALIHAATMVTAGVYLLMRMFPLLSGSEELLAAIAIMGGVTAFYGATCAVAQRDLKRVLAYSTISQIGYMFLGVGSGGIDAATFHLIVHAFFKALLFLGAGCVISALHHEQDIYRMGGIRRSLPATFLPFLAGVACLAGVPLTGGFFSKDAILTAVWQKRGDGLRPAVLPGAADGPVDGVLQFPDAVPGVRGGSRGEESHRSAGHGADPDSAGAAGATRRTDQPPGLYRDRAARRLPGVSRRNRQDGAVPCLGTGAARGGGDSLALGDRPGPLPLRRP
ncbi:NADH-quinone oxidoreductase subunit L [Geobacter sp. OR-1]|uniref:NADH-quinone oxidoreductase subunit L n=1 Tax=Geobacter sp. OR-1 TaxID=1266765 RepID=UPI000543C8B8|nr:NADH-quinone oxidoreductase subunit L [Geobacter sp. OR-1]GAM11668.1 NADH-quinone oxidoreductase subunit L [Geobacter sp. OR-1]